MKIPMVANIVYAAKMIALALIIGFGMNVAYAAWVGPTEAPPGGNTYAPVDTSSTAQIKSGGLWLDSLGTDGGASFGGSVGIGTVGPGALLHVVTPYAKTDTTDRWISRFSSNDAAASFPFGLAIGMKGAAALANRTMELQTQDWGTADGGNLALQPIAGNVGIGTTDPTVPLTVSGTSGDGTPVFRITSTVAPAAFNWAGSLMNSSLSAGKNTALFIGQAESTKNSGYIGFNYSGSGSTSNFLTFGLHGIDNVLNINGSGNVGIGTTNPLIKLAVAQDLTMATNNTIDGQLVLQGATTAGKKLGIGYDTTGNGFGFIKAGNDNTAWTVLALQPISGSVGIGRTDPGYKLDVSGTFRATSNWSLGGAADTNLNMNSKDITAVNKLTVTTIDPVYSIGGTKYATYVSDTVGLKMETYGKVALSKNGGKLSYTIDLAHAEKGSDLWLFWQTIDEGTNLKDIIVSLTPEFDGRVWYELNPAQKQIIIYGEPVNSQSSTISDYFVSYHLVAPRHDASQWKNVLVNSEEKGTVLPVK